MILLTHFTDMTFYLKDVIYLSGIIFSVAIAYGTITNNKKRINKLEEKTDNLKEVFSNLRVDIAKLKFDIIKEIKEMINNNK